MLDIWDIWNHIEKITKPAGEEVNAMIGKRPENVLIKGETQTVSCPNCGKQTTVDARTTSITCSKCGESVNWGLRK